MTSNFISTIEIDWLITNALHAGKNGFKSLGLVTGYSDAFFVFSSAAPSEC